MKQYARLSLQNYGIFMFFFFIVKKKPKAPLERRKLNDKNFLHLLHRMEKTGEACAGKNDGAPGS